MLIYYSSHSSWLDLQVSSNWAGDDQWSMAVHTSCHQFFHGPGWQGKVAIGMLGVFRVNVSNVFNVVSDLLLDQQIFFAGQKLEKAKCK